MPPPMEAALEILPPCRGKLTREHKFSMGLPWGKGFILFSVGNIPETLVIRWIRVRNTLRFRSICLLPPQLVASGISVNELVGLQVIFRNRRVVPLAQEILVKREVETADIWVVFKNVSRHSLNIQPGLIVLQPDVVAQDCHLQERGVGVELEFDILLGSLKDLEKINALSDLFSESLWGHIRIGYPFRPDSRSFTVRVEEHNFCFPAIPDDLMEFSIRVCKGTKPR